MEANVLPAFVVGVHRSTFRCGEAAEVIGVSMYQPEGKPYRLCLLIRFADGETDRIPVSDIGQCYRMLCPCDVRLIPKDSE